VPVADKLKSHIFQLFEFLPHGHGMRIWPVDPAGSAVSAGSFTDC
jgi:hypothetical protein